MRHMPLSMTELNKDIRENEVWAAIKQQQQKPLNNRVTKASFSEKKSQETVVPFLTSCFNHLFIATASSQNNGQKRYWSPYTRREALTIRITTVAYPYLVF